MGKNENFLSVNYKIKIVIVFMALVILVAIIAGIVYSNNYSVLEDYDMSNISFSDSTVTYDGTVHSIEISGDLPDDVSVSYTYDGEILDGETDAGEYTVVASFTGDSSEYNTISDMTATLTIEQASLSDNFSLSNQTVTYDGSEHSLSVVENLSASANISYTYDGQILDGETDAGTYDVVATITYNSTNYSNDEIELEATLIIEQASIDLDDVVFEGDTVEYDGQEHSITASNLPDGVSVSYTYDGDSVSGEQYAGNYTVEAIFTVDDENYKATTLSAALIINNTDMSDYTYTIYSQTSEITLDAYKGSDTTVIIPTEVSVDYVVYSVTALSASAFADNTSITSVEISSGITSISDSTFSGCTSLETITIDGDITEIGESAFDDSGITSISLPSSLTTIGASAFASCSSLISIEIPSKVTIISDNVFENCTKLETITIDGDITEIGESAFDGSGITSISLPSSLTTIGSAAFYDCASLESIEIPSKVTIISDKVFEYCTKLETVTIDGDITEIGSYSFEESGITSISLPSSLTTIGSAAFYNCASLESIEIPSKVTIISTYIFTNCTKLKSVTFDGDITEIQTDAFSYTGITSITLPSSLATIGSAFRYCRSLTSIEIPSKVTNISAASFYNCTSLESVVFDGNISNIGTSAFYNCTALTSITIPSSVDTIGKNAFYDCSSLTEVTFEDTSLEWILSLSGEDDLLVYVFDSSQNATYLVSTYYNYVWTKSSN